ncbi:hypothetical protein R3P38DRAFT_2731346 [Favolaschia claudopus]|uniref:MYND-type domain-containing protein n=1 Tax=Favolaschia claudopus TaxID=2862362 RepID=A0AAW0A7I8_9AGAR
MTILFPLPKDARNDPLKWNADWEVFIDSNFAQPNSPALCFNIGLEALRDSQNGLKDKLEDYQTFVSRTCAIQCCLTCEALDHFADDDFENKWMLAGPEERGKHILGALAAVCSKARNLHNARAYCPEIRLMSLSRDGKAFLSLLKSVMLEDASFIPSEPKSVPNAAWDAFSGIRQKSSSATDEERITLATILIMRTKLISLVVHSTMRSFFGKEAPPLTVERVDQKPQRGRPRAELIEAVGSKAAKARMKEEKAGAMDMYREQLDVCSYAGCAKTAPNRSVRFSRCTRCAKIERSVLYCSRECQRADWNGPHKAICGKTLNFDIVSAAVEHPTHGPSSRSHIGLPVDSFKRSIPLVHQVTQLNLNPTVDYFLHSSSKKVPFTFPANACCRYLFRLYRELAMTTGASGQVAHMAHLLCLMFASDRAVAEDDREGITPDIIVEQLGREYEVEELRKLVGIAQELQDEDELHRPVGLRNAPLELWEYDDKLFNLSGTRVTFGPAVGPPVDGFTRSPELTGQVNDLIDWPDADYFFINKDKENIQWDYGAGTYLQKAFRAAREAAMTTGSAQHVATMAHFLCISFSGLDTQNETGVSPKTIVAQMGREFRMNNVRELVLQAQRDQQADPLRRPPLFWDAPLDVWEAEDQQRHWSHLVVTFD